MPFVIKEHGICCGEEKVTGSKLVRDGKHKFISYLYIYYPLAICFFIYMETIKNPQRIDTLNVNDDGFIIFLSLGKVILKFGAA